MDVEPLSRRYSRAMAHLVAGVMLVASVVVLSVTIVSFNRDLERRLDYATGLARASFPYSMWNLDERALGAVLDALFVDDNVIYAGLETGGAIIMTKVRSEFTGRSFPSFSDSTMFVARAVDMEFQGEPVGVVYLVLTKQPLILQVALWSGAILAVSALLTLLIYWRSGILTRRSLFDPLNALEHAAAAIARGNLDHSIDTASGDEIGSLARSLDSMRRSIQELVVDLRAANHRLSEQNVLLEQEVGWRTEELRGKNAELEEAVVELERSNADLERFAYVSSHDLQEPLRMVTSYLQLLERNLRDEISPENREFLNYAVDGAKRMSQLIRDLLAYSRVTTEGSPIAPVDMADVVETAEANLRTAIDHAGASLEVSGPLPLVMGDEAQLVSVLQNLIANAVKYCAEDVTPEVRIGVERNPTSWTFSVADNGIGMEEQYKERIFIIFQRLHGRHEYEGTGIGLAVCKRIIERHHGRIWVESAPGQGSTFSFTLPAEPEDRNVALA